MISTCLDNSKSLSEERLLGPIKRYSSCYMSSTHATKRIFLKDSKWLISTGGLELNVMVTTSKNDTAMFYFLKIYSSQKIFKVFTGSTLIKNIQTNKLHDMKEMKQYENRTSVTYKCIITRR